MSPVILKRPQFDPPRVYLKGQNFIKQGLLQLKISKINNAVTFYSKNDPCDSKASGTPEIQSHWIVTVARSGLLCHTYRNLRPEQGHA